MNIYVDADACPVKDIIVKEANKFNIPVTLVKSYSHYSHAEEPEGVTTIYVDPGADAADYKIMQLAKTNDIIVTQDYGLASLGIAKGCSILHHKGFLYTSENIDQLLQTRYEHAKARRGGIRTKGPKAFTNEDRENFKALLYKVLTSK